MTLCRQTEYQMETMMAKITATSFKTTVFVLLLGAVCALSITNVRAAQPNGKQTQTDTVDTNKLQQEWTKSIATLKGYSADQRDQAIAEAASMLTAMDKRIDQLESRTAEQWATLNENMRRQREASLRNLRHKRNELSEWYGGMKHGSVGAWGTMKQGFINAFDTLSDSFRKARTELDNDTRRRQ